MIPDRCGTLHVLCDQFTPKFPLKLKELELLRLELESERRSREAAEVSNPGRCGWMDVAQWIGLI